MNSRALTLWFLLAAAACDDEAAVPDAGALADGAATAPVDGATTKVDASTPTDSAAASDAAAPSFRFWVEPSSIALVPGTCVGIKAKIQRLRYDGQILIGVGGTLPSVGVSTSHVAAGASEGDIILITPTRAEPVTGGQLLLAASSDDPKDHQRLYMPVDILPRAPGDAGAPDGGFNQSPLGDQVCRSILDAVPAM